MITSPMITGQNLGQFKNHFKKKMVSMMREHQMFGSL
jgi:hypothetical protein